MIRHYLKVAVRNLLKYKVQTVVSVVGLAVGFVCFAFSAMWVRYDMTYDARPKGAERMYLLCMKSAFSDVGYNPNMPLPSPAFLKKQFPEVEEGCAYMYWPDVELKAEGMEPIQVPLLTADSCFLQMFDVRLLAGSPDFLHDEEQVALTEESARRLFGTTDVLGRELSFSDMPKKVTALVSSLEHSNFAFGCLCTSSVFSRYRDDWGNISFYNCIRLGAGVSASGFQQKLNDFPYKVDGREREPFYKNVKLQPLTKYHYSNIGRQQDFVKLQYLILFLVIGGLVVICSLFNYLSLFVARMGIRLKELGLRRVCGSSTGGILLMFMMEYGLLVLLSGLVGMALMEIFSTPFRRMSGVEGSVYGESLLYFAGLLLLSFLVLLPFAWRRTSQISSLRHRRFFFYRCNICFQIFTGILFIFCMAVLLKQLCHLTTTNLGWERKEMAVINSIYPDSRYDEIADKVARLPGIREFLKGHLAIFPQSSRMSLLVDSWEGKEAEAEGIEMITLVEGREIIDFYHLQLLEGDFMHPEETDKVILNEAAVKAMGLTDPVGKKIRQFGTDRTIVGVVKDFHTTAPTVPVKPTMLIGVNGMEYFMHKTDILLKYHSGQWKELKHEVEQLFNNEYPDVHYQLVQVEEEYDKYLKSEQVLMKLLLFVSMVCVCMAAFGIFSLVTLSCEQRRKEIAVRKVNGATVSDILRMFVREYAALLLLASAVSFPLGYVLMRRWLENYVEQTVISWWIYLSIFAGIALVIALCIGWRVWQAARMNPAEVVKRE